MDKKDECMENNKNLGKKITENNVYFSKQYRIIFISTMIIGLCAHLYRFTNMQWNFDELAISVYGGYGVGIASGRWFLTILGDFMQKIIGNYSLPVFTGVIACILLSLSVCMIIYMLQIEDKLLCILISGIFISFPAVTAMFFYMYTAGYYALAIFLCVAAVYISYVGKYKWKYVISCLLLACSMGIYQAYFPMAVSLYVLVILHYLLTNYHEKNIWYKALKLGIKYLLVLGSGLVTYLVILKVLLHLTSQSLSDYQGINSMGVVKLTNLIDAGKNAYMDFIGLNFKNIYFINPTIVSRAGLLVLNIIMLISILFVIIKKRNSILNALALFLILLIFPISCFLIYLMAPDAFKYALTLYAAVFAFIFPIAIIEWLPCYSDKINILKKKVTYFVLGLMVLIYTWFSNANYVACDYTNYHDFAYMEVLVTQIKSIEGYHENMPVAFVGEHFGDETVTTRFMPLAELGGRRQSNLNAYSRLKLITKIIGFSPSMIEEQEQLDNLAELAEVKEMPAYPNYGSIKIVGDTIVVKLADAYGGN